MDQCKIRNRVELIAIKETLRKN